MKRFTVSWPTGQCEIDALTPREAANRVHGRKCMVGPVTFTVVGKMDGHTSEFSVGVVNG